MPGMQNRPSVINWSTESHIFCQFNPDDVSSYRHENRRAPDSKVLQGMDHALYMVKAFTMLKRPDLAMVNASFCYYVDFILTCTVTTYYKQVSPKVRSSPTW
jgi:hypothetical protein